MSNLARATVTAAAGLPKLAQGELSSGSPAAPVSLGAASTTLTAAQMSSGSVYLTGGTTATVTTLTGVQIADAFPEMNVGDVIEVAIANHNSGTATIAAGTNVTLVGTATLATTVRGRLRFELTSKTLNATTYQSMSSATQGSSSINGVPNAPTHSAATFNCYIM